MVPAKDVILALEKGAAAGGADPPKKGQVAREAIDAFILGMVRFKWGVVPVLMISNTRAQVQ